MLKKWVHSRNGFWERRPHRVRLRWTEQDREERERAILHRRKRLSKGEHRRV